MTTVAFDGKTLASDSQLTKGHGTIQLVDFQKIYTPNDEKEYWEVNGVKVVAFGIAGDAKCVEYIKETLRKGVDFRTQIDVMDDLIFDAILVCEDHNVFDWHVDTNKEKRNTWSQLIPINGPLVLGSGGRYALAVMAIGKNAVQAVKAAVKIDAFSGGPIQEFTLADKPLVPSTRPEHLKVKTEEKVEEKKEEPVSKKGSKAA